MNWIQVLESIGSVAVVALPPLIAHYRKLATVLETVTAILNSVESVRVAQIPPVPTPVQPLTVEAPRNSGSGMFNENTD